MTNGNDHVAGTKQTRHIFDDRGVLIHTKERNNTLLTKREHFAVMILQGLMANPERYKYISDFVERNDFEDGVQEEATRKNCHKAVLIADALIAELNKEAK